MTQPANAKPLILNFYPQPPYDFALTMDVARFYSVLGRRHGSAYRRVLHVGAGLALVELTGIGTREVPQLQVTRLAANGEIDQSALAEKLARVLNLHVDLSAFYEFAQTDPILAHTVQQVYGLQTLASDSMFEALVSCIIEQQIALKMAHAAERWLIAWAGDYIEYEGETYYAFPTPKRITSMTVEDLKPLKITFQRMQRIIDIARAITEGSMDLEALRDAPPSEAYTALRSIKGVGHWTAVWAMIKGMGHYANFGSADVGLRAAINSYYFGQTGNADREVVDTLLARYHPFDGTAAFYTLSRWALEKYSYL